MDSEKTVNKEMFIGKIWKSISDKSIWVHLLLMAVIGILLIFLLRSALSIYTKHGQKVSMTSFEGMDIDSAKEEARDNGFELVINDSVYLVNEVGGLIVRQSPKEGAIVKKGRKVYLTVTKSVAEEVNSGLFPDMYGKSFDNIKLLLERRHQLKTNIKEERFDPGPKNVILEAYYKDELLVDKNSQMKDVSIPKGSTIDFVVSQRTRGAIAVPELTCLTYDAVAFVLSSNELKLGEVHTDGTVSADQADAYVVKQEPAAGQGSTINIGESISIYLSQKPSSKCL